MHTMDKCCGDPQSSVVCGYHDESPQPEYKADVVYPFLEAFCATRTGSTRIATSIQRLPNELLLYTFTFLFLSTSSELIHYQLYRASAVCRLWHSIIKTTPRFWTRLPKFEVSWSSKEALPGSDEGELEGMERFATFNQRAALQSSVDAVAYVRDGHGERSDNQQELEAAVPILWTRACNNIECLTGDVEPVYCDAENCEESDVEVSDEEFESEFDVGESTEGESDFSSSDSEGSFWVSMSDTDGEASIAFEYEDVKEDRNEDSKSECMFHGYLHGLLEFLVLSYPLPVEAHLCVPPSEVYLCIHCRGNEALMTYTFVQVFKRARALSIDLHTSSVDHLKLCMMAEMAIDEAFPFQMRFLAGNENYRPNLKRPLPIHPVDGRSPRYPYLEDLTVILSHSAIPFMDEHNIYDTIMPLFKDARLSSLRLVNSVRVLPEYFDLMPESCPLYTSLFNRMDWWTLREFEGVFHGIGDIRVVLCFARNLEHATFTVYLDDDDDGMFPFGDRAAMEEIIAVDSEPLGLDVSTIRMSNLRTLQIKLAQDSFQPFKNLPAPPLSPPLPTCESELDAEESESDSEGPGRALFRFILLGVEVPQLERLTLSAAFLQLNWHKSHPSVRARRSLRSFFSSCQSSLRHVELEKFPIGMKGRGPRQIYAWGSKIPVFYQHLFEAIRPTANTSNESALEEIVIHEPITYVQSKKVSGVLRGFYALTDMDNVRSLIQVPDSLKRIQMALYDSKAKEDEWDGYATVNLTRQEMTKVDVPVSKSGIVDSEGKHQLGYSKSEN